ncbi:Rossmann-fold NAD(P)-binding domain-containing protein [Natronococcus occultus]|nr:hypothetical protein [Natronococcus occultus]
MTDPGTSTTVSTPCCTSSNTLRPARHVQPGDANSTSSTRTPREADTAHTHAGISKANALLGDEPTRDSREGVREVIDWDRTNREWDEPLVLQP